MTVLWFGYVHNSPFLALQKSSYEKRIEAYLPLVEPSWSWLNQRFSFYVESLIVLELGR